METKKITLNELRTLVKQMVKEETDSYEKISKKEAEKLFNNNKTIYLSNGNSKRAINKKDGVNLQWGIEYDFNEIVKDFIFFNKKILFYISGNKMNENIDTNKYSELTMELRNVCKRFQVYLNPSDIKDALINVSDIYTDK
jgi:hypothetical protein